MSGGSEIGIGMRSLLRVERSGGVRKKRSCLRGAGGSYYSGMGWMSGELGY